MVGRGYHLLARLAWCGELRRNVLLLPVMTQSASLGEKGEDLEWMAFGDLWIAQNVLQVCWNHEASAYEVSDSTRNPPMPGFAQHSSSV